MSRYNDIQAHLKVARASLATIQKRYQSSLEAKEIDPQLKIEIKNYLENLRSVLDYLASEINERYCVKRTRAYFPTSCKDSQTFHKHMNRYFPGLEATRKDLFTELESYQPYACNAPESLSLFATLVNQNKHDRLTPQTRTEKRGLRLDFSGGGSITLGPDARMTGTGKIVSGGQVLDLGGRVISGDSPAAGLPSTIKQTVISWVGFRFDAIKREVIPFLRETLGVVKGITNDLAKDLWP